MDCTIAAGFTWQAGRALFDVAIGAAVLLVCGTVAAIAYWWENRA